MRKLFRDRRARRYLLGQSLSLFGDMTLWLAAGIWVKTLTGSNGAAGLTFFFFALPQVGAPLAGALVDRLPRRPVLIWANLVTAAWVLLLLLVRGPGQVWLIYLVMFGYGASYGVLSSGRSALLRILLPDELLADANGYLRTVQEGLRLIGPITGATLFALFGGGVVAALDAATFVVAAAALWSVTVDEAPAPQRTEAWLSHLLAGLRYLWQVRVLRQQTLAGAVALLTIGMVESAAFAVVGEGLHRPPTFLGLLVATQGVGALVAGPTAAPFIRRWGEGVIMAGGLFAFAVGTGLATGASLPVVVAGFVLVGFALPWFVVGSLTAVQRLTPLYLQGRVASASDLLTGTPQTVSIAVGAALVSVVDYHLVLGFIAATVAGCGLYLVTRPEQRQLGRRGGAAELDQTA